jgi:cell wall-associated protease
VSIVAAVLMAAAACSEQPARSAGERVTVGIVDTGIDEDQFDRILDRAASRSLVPGEGLSDLDGHGTEMASILHRGAPDARLVAAKVVDAHGATTDARLAAGIEHLVDRGASVVLVSLAGAEPLPRTSDAIERAGEEDVVVVLAAGNDGLDLDHATSYPGSSPHRNAVVVAATGPDGSLLGTSNRNGPVTATAPGRVPTCGLDGRQTVATGTSAAAAIVAAWAASERSLDPAPAREHVDRLRDVRFEPQRANESATVRATCSTIGMPADNDGQPSLRMATE